MLFHRFKNKFNSFLYAIFYYLLNKVVSFVPIHFIRNFVYKMVLGKMGYHNSFLMGLELRYAKNIMIGDNNVFNKSVLLDGRGGQLRIGNCVDIAQETNIWTLEHDVHDDYHKDKGGDVIIEDYVWIASRCTILPGVTIGRGAVVACNSVVTKNVPPMAIVAGIPARVIGNRNSQLKYKPFHKPMFQ